jgi:flavin reductase (DIM6/NTAB) family NADH-FMN oxidoreductase RutF
MQHLLMVREKHAMKQSIPPQRGFYPQPAYLVGTYKPDHTPNFAFITLVTGCSVTPPMILFATRGHNITHQLIDEHHVFSANMVNEALLPFADYCGHHSGKHQDKLAGWDVTVEQGKVLDVPVIDLSPLVYECTCVGTYTQGDGILYIGEVKNIQIDSRIDDPQYGNINLLDLKPVIYAPGGYYAIRNTLSRVRLSKGRIQ